MHNFHELKKLHKLESIADGLVGSRHGFLAVAIVADSNHDEDEHKAHELEQVVQDEVNLLEMLLLEAELLFLQLTVQLVVISHDVSRLLFLVVVFGLPSIEIDFQP